MTAENSEFLKIDTQVCLVSREPMPNLLPILHFSPRSVILIATPEMHENANRLKAVIHQNKPQLAVDVEYLSSAYDYDAIVETMFNVLIHVDKAAPEGEIVLNATGGTKLMVLAAVSVFTANNKKIFYLNVENGEIIFIPVSGTDLMHSKQAIHIPISLVDYLKVHDYSVQKSDVPVRELSYDFFEQLVSQQQKFEQAIAAVNAVAQNALENFKARKGLGAEIQNADSSGFKRLLSIFQDEKLLFLQQNKVVFPDESARFTLKFFSHPT